MTPAAARACAHAAQARKYPGGRALGFPVRCLVGGWRGGVGRAGRRAGVRCLGCRGPGDGAPGRVPALTARGARSSAPLDLDVSSPLTYGTPSSRVEGTPRSGVRGTPVRQRPDLGSARKGLQVDLHSDGPAAEDIVAKERRARHARAAEARPGVGP
uniref:DNA replication licensing factor MCM4-like n=1 Tax=Camelus bactrianus TaxID=9837 RepID=A0A9W3FV82_CAMBA|nr:DNA replication licensing factor MCM4-like [Camelus bactrianus]